MFRRFFYSFGQKMQRFMYGRYGNDALTRFLSIVALVLIGLHFITRLWAFYVLAAGLIIWTMFRTLSRNYNARRKELEKYQAISGKISGWFRLRKRMFAERKYSKYYKCKQCKAYLRVPKGRGKLEISCPKCKYTFIKRT